MSQILLLFVDGLGLGSPEDPGSPLRDPALDLLANFHEPGWSPPPEGNRPPTLPSVTRLSPLPEGGRVVACDASLGIDGLPQSATGQTTLFTGENGGAALNRHYTGFPTITLQKILVRASVLKRLVEAGRTARFANAFSPLFFEMGEELWKRSRMGATSWANRAADLPFLTFEDLEKGEALFHDITHDSMKGDPRLGEEKPLPTISPELGGERLVNLAAGFDFTLFEFFLTDKAGHEANAEWAGRELRKLERFLASILDSMDPGKTTVLLTSDHGNVEDLRTGRHTHNPVPFLAFGAEAEEFAEQVQSLEDVTPAILRSLT
jgi:2,3-bisphosphoglycerate-independent phosphoglycerate mutase